MKGICRLYKREDDLQKSHIFPKFVINYTKRTGSKYLRSFLEPDKRMQDGIKSYLLSREAEQEFSKRENWFADNIFRPYLSGKVKLGYTSDLYYFAISFLWRILISELERTKDINKKWYYKQLKKVEKEWRRYLANGILPNRFKNINILFTDRVVNHPTELKNVDFYMTRIMDGTIVDNETKTCCFVYGKFNRFIFWGVVKEYGDEDKLQDVQINPYGGNFSIPQKLDYFPINSFFYNRISVVGNLPESSLEQQIKIEKEMIKDKDFWNKDLGKSLLNDMNL